jgi:hypothetical protein
LPTIPKEVCAAAELKCITPTIEVLCFRKSKFKGDAYVSVPPSERGKGTRNEQKAHPLDLPYLHLLLCLVLDATALVSHYDCQSATRHGSFLVKYPRREAVLWL